MRIQELLDEHKLAIDDVRWYLAREQADRLLSYRDHPEELAHLLWSGELEADLYEMEDRFLAALQEKLDRGRTDEAQAHQTVREIARSAEERRRMRR
ncbi:MAG: hypothetical protein ACLFPO_10495 [Spirochaetaceae bacterium]